MKYILSLKISKNTETVDNPKTNTIQEIKLNEIRVYPKNIARAI